MGLLVLDFETCPYEHISQRFSGGFTKHSVSVQSRSILETSRSRWMGSPVFALGMQRDTIRFCDATVSGNNHLSKISKSTT